MKDDQQTAQQKNQSIEIEYINSMLNIDCLDMPAHDVVTEIIDFNEAYTKPEIECTIFEIEGINMALPSSVIKEIVKQQAITSEQSNNSLSVMCAGQIKYNEDLITVIDLAVPVMKGIAGFEKSRKGAGDIVDIILLKDGSTGFICNETIDSQTVTNEQICWRDKESERVWLAGTVVQMGFSLLDINGVIKLLDNNE